MTDGIFEESEEGSVQGNIISPLLAYIYMHNVLTLWYKFVIIGRTTGRSFLAVYAESNSKRKYGRKPETFDFLGFTFYCGKGRKTGNFCVKLKTNRKKFSMKLKQTKEWLYQNNDLPVKELIAKLNKKLIGHYRYYGVSHNMNKLSSFLHYVQRYLFKVLNRRSHKKSYLWNGYIDMLKVYPLAQPKIYVRLF